MTVIIGDFTRSKKCKRISAVGELHELNCVPKYPFSVDIYTDEMNKYPFNVIEMCADSACQAALNLIQEIKLPKVRCVAVYHGALEQRNIHDEALKLHFPLRKTNNKSDAANE